MFELGRTDGRARVGKITVGGVGGGRRRRRNNKEEEEEEEVVLSTPTCFLSTRSGFPPNIPCDLLKQLTELKHLQINFQDFYENFDGDKGYEKSLHEFIALEDYILLVSLREPCTFEEAPLHPTQITISGFGGKITVTPEKYLKVIQKMKPDFYTGFGMEIHLHSSKKRKIKTEELSLQWLDQCLQRISKEEVRSKVFATIGRTRDTASAVHLARETTKRDVFGFVVGGFDSGELFSERQAAILPVLNELPNEKPRMVVCCGTPDDVLQAVSFGFDIINSNYPDLVTEHGCALTFPLSFSSSPSSSSSTSTSTSTTEKGSYKINLWDKIYQRDGSPIQSGCSCFACTHHTKAYLHHLLNTHELLASILLSIHNNHHYMEFFRTIREQIVNQSFDAFQQNFTRFKLSSE